MGGVNGRRILGYGKSGVDQSMVKLVFALNCAGRAVWTYH